MTDQDKPNPDDLLSDKEFIFKYQLYFTKWFGPKYTYGVTGIGTQYNPKYDKEPTLLVRVRVKPAYQSTKGTTMQITVDQAKFENWRKNVKLFEFVNSN